MNDQHYFADVDLPFHVWVREAHGRGFRWVLRHAAEVQGRFASPRSGSASESSPGRRTGGAR